MAGSMKDIKLRIKSVESTMQITKAMELVASSKMRRAKERVEHSRPYFETLYKTLTEIAAADPRARNPYLRRSEIKRTLLVVIAGDRGLAGGYNANVLKLAAQESGNVEVLKQNRSAPVPVEKQVAILYATIHDYLVNVKVPDVAEYEKSLYEYLDNDAAGAAVMDTIRTTGNLDKDTEEQLKAVLTRYTESFVKAH